jgi:hypothetical protein
LRFERLRGGQEQKTPGTQTAAAGRISRLLLGGLFHISRELENLPTLLYGHPLHLWLESGRNVELNHLCHTILRSISDRWQPTLRCCNVTMKTGLPNYLIRCELDGKVAVGS